MEALLNHVGRLIRNESTSIADCRTHIRGLQRKLKGNKELLDSRVSAVCYTGDDDDDDDDDSLHYCVRNYTVSQKTTLM